MVEAEEDIRESLRILFLTRKGERVMQPDFGSDLHDLVFEPMDSDTETAIALAIERAVLFHEPRISLTRVSVTAEDWLGGDLAILLEYRIRATNSRQNVVFPFYLQEGTLVSGAPRDAAATRAALQPPR